MTITPSTKKGAGTQSLNRRRVLQLIAASGPASVILSAGTSALESKTTSSGYGKDVDMHNPTVTWEKILTTNQLKNVTILCDIIIPADEKSPAASTLEIPDFVDEWVSAPYPTQKKDKMTILYGLKYLNAQASSLHNKQQFYTLSDQEQANIFETLALSVAAGEVTSELAIFYSRLIYIVAGGYYTTETGIADLGYVGNIPLESFDGPPKEIRDILGL